MRYDAILRGRRLAAGMMAAALLGGLAAGVAKNAGPGTAGAATPPRYELDDSHFHLTDYIQEGTDLRDFLKMMGKRVGRVALFGIPLQQQWSYRVSGKQAPTYYLESDAPLYYYSFTDAHIATAYLSLPKQDRARFDPMITGFNPADMYAADHIRRVLRTYPGVFTGIGEFTIHKEFVSAKISGDVPSLLDPALDRIFDLCEEAGLVAILHNDISVPFPKEAKPPAYFDEVTAVFKRHPKTTIIWAHMGVGRVIQPVRGHVKYLEAILKDPAMSHVVFDISWHETAKYVVASEEATRITAELINRYPDRFLFGTDVVAPKDQKQYLEVYEEYAPLWTALAPEAREKVRKGNYERIFDEARRRVRAWEAKQ
jgi:predicted TIM-barrel fold metal-dependent hydrolase